MGNPQDRQKSVVLSFNERLKAQTTNGNATLDDIKPLISEAIEFLEKTEDYGTPKTADALLMLGNIPSSLMDAPERSSLLQIDTSNFLSKSVCRYFLQQGYSRLFVEIASSLQRKLNDKENEERLILQCQLNLYQLYSGIIIRYTHVDTTAAFCKSLCEDGILGVLLQTLTYVDNPANKINPTVDGVNLTVKSKTVILTSLSNIITRCPSNRQAYRNANAIGILSEIQMTNMEVRILSLLTLAYIVDENENEKLRKSQDCVRFLTEMFTKAVFSPKHMIRAADTDDANAMIVYSATELLDGLNHLAVIDDNKLEIHKHGGLPAIIRMLQPDFSEDERRVAAEALWNLAFVDKIRKNNEVQETTQTLQRLTQSNNKSVKDASTYALWEIRGNQLPVTEERHPQDSPPPSYKETLRRDAASRDYTGDHLMLSYQWDTQQTVLAIRDTLTRKGYNVWMDIDDMRGDTLEAMAKALETSSVVIICMTEKYKDSPSCRSEASYASNLKKPIIPLLLESGYKPDGWLGLLLGTKLYYKFSSDDEFERSMQRLIKEIGNRGRKDKNDESDGATPAHPQQAENQRSSPSQSHTQPAIADDTVNNWTKEDVQTWLKENELSELCSPLGFCCGSHLKEMYDQYCLSPKEFKSDLKSEYQLGFSTLIKFITALNKLFK